MAATSWAHISMYRASVAMIAGVFCPKKFVATNAANNTRLATISGGDTVIANAASKAAAAARAWLALSSAWAAVVFSHHTSATTEATIAADVGPTQGPLVNSVTTE